MTRYSDQIAEFANAIEFSALRFPQPFTFDVAFGDLGSGASSAEAMAGFPTLVFVLGATVEILTAFAGEADLACRVGDTGDDDGLMGSVNLNAVAAGTILGAIGVQQGFRWEADLSTDGLDATFTATQLDDVTAGELRVRIYYAVPQLT